MAYHLKMCNQCTWQDISVLVGIATFILPWTTKGSLKNNFTFYTPMQPAWRRCESSEYPDIPAFSRLARRTPQRLKLWIYLFVNPKRIAEIPLSTGLWVSDLACGFFDVMTSCYLFLPLYICLCAPLKICHVDEIDFIAATGESLVRQVQ